MKLIDLLVQHSSDNFKWPDGATKCMQSCIDGEILFNREGHSRSGIHLPVSDDWDQDIVTREQYEAALTASKQPEWSGEGLPPVGAKIEVQITINS